MLCLPPAGRHAPTGFYLRHLRWLALAVPVLLLWDASGLDIWLADAAYDPVSGTFPQRSGGWAQRFGHDGARLVFALIALAVIATAALSLRLDRLRPHRRALGFLLAALIAGPSVVGILKHYSASPCPWNVDRYGGSAPHLTLFEPAPAGMKPGRCFPAGHASGGFALMAFALLCWPAQPRRALQLWLAALSIGLLLGGVQQLRGAHYLSHTLWSAWVVWLVVLAVHAAFFHDGRRNATTPPQTGAGSTTSSHPGGLP